LERAGPIEKADKLSICKYSLVNKENMREIIDAYGLTLITLSNSADGKIPDSIVKAVRL